MLLANVWQKRHETSAFDGCSDRVLANRRAAGLSTTDDTAVTIYELFQGFNIFVIDEHWTWTLAIYKQRILFLSS